jgi:hypothetical protein
VTLLSAEWFEELASRLGSASVGEADGPRLRLGVRVTGAPAGTVSYTVVFGAGEAATLEVGDDSSAEVVLVESYETAGRIAAGALISDELARGAVKLEGDVTKLLAAAAELGALIEQLATP